MQARQTQLRFLSALHVNFMVYQIEDNKTEWQGRMKFKHENILTNKKVT